MRYAAALLVVGLVLVAAPAWAFPRGGSHPTVHCGPDATPAPALAAGFTCETMDISFTSMSAIDLANGNIAVDAANTNQQGFDLYPYMFWTQSAGYFPSGGYGTSPGPIPSGDYSIATALGCGTGSDNVTRGLCYKLAADNTWLNIMSCAPTNSNNKGYVGTSFTGGYYIDVNMGYYYNGAEQNPYTPAVYMHPLEFLLAQKPGTPFYTAISPVHFTEKDNCDCAYTGGSRDWEWPLNGSGSAQNQLSSNLGPIYGLLVEPKSVNAGGNVGYGFLGYYQNDVIDPGPQSLYFSASGPPIPNPGSYGNGVFGPTDTEHSCLLFQSGASSPILIYSIKAWARP